MAIGQFAKLQSSDAVQNRTQDLIAKAVNPALASILLNGVPVRNVALASGVALAVNHKLGRQPLGWFMTDIDAAATVFRVSWNDKQIKLQASADVNINLWVF